MYHKQFQCKADNQPGVFRAIWIKDGLAQLLKRLRFLELARLVVRLPSALLLAVFKETFVPELAVGMVSLPFAVLLLFIVEAACTPRFATLVEPFPPTNNLPVFVVTG